MYLLVLQDSASEPAGLGGVCRQDSSSQLFSAGPACFPRQSLYFGVFSLEDLIISQKGSPRGNASVSHGCLPSFTAGKGSGSPWQRQGGRPAGPSGPVLSFPNCRGCWLLTAYGWVPLQELPSAKGYTLSSGILSTKINLCWHKASTSLLRLGQLCGAFPTLELLWAQLRPLLQLLHILPSPVAQAVFQNWSAKHFPSDLRYKA